MAKNKTMRFEGLFAAGVLAALASGCTASADLGRPAKPLDCAWLSGDNCWKQTVQAAASCLPDSSQVGALSADGKTCTYASGDVVTFDPPLTLPLPVPDPALGFTVTSHGQTCLSYAGSDTERNLELTTAAGTVRVQVGSQTYQVSCPGGDTYLSGDWTALFAACDAGVLSSPGAVTASLTFGASSGVGFGLSATSSSGGTPVFSCSR